jgi:lysozyme
MPTQIFRALGVVFFLAIFAGGAVLYYLNYSPDRVRYAVRGIDVSRHQGSIDWARVAADDVAFAIIKATEGGDFVDALFKSNVDAARAAGLAVGAYHFFTLCRAGVEQAANFLAQVDPGKVALPPAIDLEYEGNCSARPDAAVVGAELSAFLEKVEAAFGKPAILYVTYGFYNDYYSSLPKRPLWTRWIAWPPPGNEWTLWQYNDRGRVDGITGDVDLNVLNTYVSLAAFGG